MSVAGRGPLLPLLLGLCLPGLLTPIPAPASTTMDPSRAQGYFPNPQTHPQECGRRGRKGWVCDTANELRPETMIQADALIDSIRNTSICPCVQNACRDQFYGGYKVGVVLLPSFAGEHNGTGFQGEVIAGNIRSVHWKMGACGEDLLLLISVDGRQLYMSVGESVRPKFPVQCQLQVNYHYSEGVDAGETDHTLLLTLRRLKSILLERHQCGGTHSVIEWWHMIIIGLALLLLVFIIMGVYLKTRRRTTIV